MDNIELDNIGEDRTEQEEAERVEDTSFTENTDNADNYNTRSQIRSRTVTQSKTNTGLDEDDYITSWERQIQDQFDKKAAQRFDAIQALESMMGTRFCVTHWENSKELIDNISDIKYNDLDLSH